MAFYWFLKLLAKKPEHAMSFEEAKPRPEVFLGQQWLQKEEARMAEAILHHAGIQLTGFFKP